MPTKAEKSRWRILWDFYRENYMTVNIVIALVAGLCVGSFLVWLKPHWTPREAMYASYLGELNIRALMIFAVPQMAALLIVSVGSVEVSMTGSLAIRTVGYYIMTSIFAVTNGMLLVTSIKPGQLAAKGETNDSTSSSIPTTRRMTVDVLMDMGRNFFPPNLVQVVLETFQTNIVPTYGEDGSLLPEEEWKISQGFKPGLNFMGIISFCVVTGIAIQLAGEKAKPFLQFFQSFLDIIMVIVRFNVKTAPAGIFFITMGTIIEKGGDVGTMLASLGAYIGTVALALSVHAFIVLPILFFLVTRRLPFRFMKHLTKILGTIFGTGSSAATLPVSMACLQDDCGVDADITSFVLPVGASLNFDGTTLYEAVAVVFLAQYWGKELNLEHYLVVAFTCVSAPQGGAMTMIALLQAVGLPARAVGMVLPVDWLLNRMRSTVNVLGDCMVAGALQILLRGGFKDSRNSDGKAIENGKGSANGEAEEMQDLSMV